MFARLHASRLALVIILLFMSGTCVGRAQSIPFHELPLPQCTFPNDSITLLDNGIIARTVDVYEYRKGGRSYFYSYDKDMWQELPGYERSYRSLNDSLGPHNESRVRQVNDSLVCFSSGLHWGRSNDVICWNIFSDAHYCTLRGTALLDHDALRPEFDCATGRVRIIGYDTAAKRLVEWSAGKGDTTAVERDLHASYAFETAVFVPRSDGLFWVLDVRRDITIRIVEAAIPPDVDSVRIRRSVPLVNGRPIAVSPDTDDRGLLMRWKQYHATPEYAYGYLDPNTLKWTISPTFITEWTFDQVLHADCDHTEITYRTQHDSLESDGFYRDDGSTRAFMGRFKHRTTVRDWHRSADGRLTAVTTDSLQTSTDQGRTWMKIAPPRMVDANVLNVYSTSDGTILIACSMDVYFKYDPLRQNYEQIHGEFPIHYALYDGSWGVSSNHSIPEQFERVDDRYVAVSESYTYLADERGLVCTEDLKYTTELKRMVAAPGRLYIPAVSNVRMWLPNTVRPQDLPLAPSVSMYVPLSNDMVWLGGTTDLQFYSVDRDLSQLKTLRDIGPSCQYTMIAMFAQEVRDSLFVLFFENNPSGWCTVGSKQSIHVLNERPLRVYLPARPYDMKRGPDKTTFWVSTVDSGSANVLRVLSPDFTTITTYFLPGLPDTNGGRATAVYDDVTKTLFAVRNGRFFQSDVVSSVRDDRSVSAYEDVESCVWYSLIGEEAYRCLYAQKEHVERSVIPSGLYIRQDLSHSGSICRSECVLIRSER